MREAFIHSSVAGAGLFLQKNSPSVFPTGDTSPKKRTEKPFRASVDIAAQEGHKKGLPHVATFCGNSRYGHKEARRKTCESVRDAFS